MHGIVLPFLHLFFTKSVGIYMQFRHFCKMEKNWKNKKAAEAAF